MSFDCTSNQSSFLIIKQIPHYCIRRHYDKPHEYKKHKIIYTLLLSVIRAVAQSLMHWLGDICCFIPVLESNKHEQRNLWKHTSLFLWRQTRKHLWLLRGLRIIDYPKDIFGWKSYEQFKQQTIKYVHIGTGTACEKNMNIYLRTTMPIEFRPFGRRQSEKICHREMLTNPSLWEGGGSQNSSQCLLYKIMGIYRP